MLLRKGLTVSQLIKFFLLLVAVLALGWFFFAVIRGILLPLVISCLLAYVINPAVDRLEAVGVRRTLGILLIYLAFASIFIVAIRFMVPVVSGEVKGLKDSFIGSTWELGINNNGRSDLTITKVVSDNDSFSVVSSSFPLTLAASQGAKVTIRFSPSTREPASGTIKVFSDDNGGGVLEVSVRGNQPTVPLSDRSNEPVSGSNISLSALDHDFGWVDPSYIDRLREWIENLQPRLETYLPIFKGTDIAGEITKRGKTLARGLLERTPALIAGLFSRIIFVVVVPFVAFFLLKEGPTVKRSLVELVPNRYFEMTLNLIYRVDQQIGGYIRGQLLASIITGLLWIVGLKIIGLWYYPVKYYFIVGAVAGIANLIPFFGAIITLVVAVAVALLEHQTLGSVVPVGLVFLIVQVLESVFISPVVLARSINLHPVIVLLVVLVGGQFMGVLGMVLAVPVTGVIKVTVQTLYEGLRSYAVTRIPIGGQTR